MTSTLELTLDGSVALLTFRRADGRPNAVDMGQADELVEAARRCTEDAAVRAVVLTGSGNTFHVGGDLRGFAGAGDLPTHVNGLAGRLHEALLALCQMPKPMVTAINGVTAGAGVGLALAGDICIAAESATFTMAYTAAGLSPDGGTTWLLPRLVGLRRAQELLYTNRRLDAQEAYDLGLVTAVVEDAQLTQRALESASRLAHGPTRAYAEVKQLLQATFQTDMATQMEHETAAITAVAASADAREGISAFLEKRPPTYTGE